MGGGGGIGRRTEHRERRRERDWWIKIPRDREDAFIYISFPNSFDAENLSVYNENHYELTFLSRVLSTLTAPLWINTLIMVYLISILISMVPLLLNLITCYYLANCGMLMLGV